MGRGLFKKMLRLIIDGLSKLRKKIQDQGSISLSVLRPVPIF